jgi:DNA-binding transcriptional LysR family regulator
MERSSTDLVDVLAFVRVAETGSFARAAERMGLSKPALSRRVARLEEQLGARLLTRTARGAQPTDVGRTYYAREAVTQIAGPIRITAPLSFGIRHLAPVLAEFALANPKVELDVELEDRTVDLTAGGYDLAVRIGRLADSALVARRIAPVRKVVIASPAYLERAGRPGRPADLADHDVLVYTQDVWRFQVNGKWETIRVAPVMRSNNGEMLLEAAVAGRGITMLPSFIAAPALENLSVEPLLLDFPLEEGALHAVMPPARAPTARVRALVDFLVSRFGPEPVWDPCWTAQARAQADTKASPSAP